MESVESFLDLSLASNSNFLLICVCVCNNARILPKSHSASTFDPNQKSCTLMPPDIYCFSTKTTWSKFWSRCRQEGYQKSFKVHKIRSVNNNLHIVNLNDSVCKGTAFKPNQTNTFKSQIWSTAFFLVCSQPFVHFPGGHWVLIC